LEEEGYSEEDLDRLTHLAQETPSLGLLLSLAPVEATGDVIRRIYQRSLRSMAYTNMPVAA
jgi:alcohol dehydrogenase